MSAGAQRQARSALLLGASGLIGHYCLELLLEDEAYGRVLTLGRRPLPRTHTKLEQRTAGFDRLSETVPELRADDVFCCLGTTIRKAGSEEAFRTVDLGYPSEIARITSRNGAEQFLLVSALGADPDSRVFYNRVKGEVEGAVKALPFHGIVILRPSLLLGDRDEFRLGEAIAAPVMRAFSPLLLGPLRKYRPIPARAVAAAMVWFAKQRQEGVRIAESDRIAEVAAQRG